MLVHIHSMHNMLYVRVVHACLPCLDNKYDYAVGVNKVYILMKIMSVYSMNFEKSHYKRLSKKNKLSSWLDSFFIHILEIAH